MVMKLWWGNDDEFFEQMFAYLKEKFSIEVPDEYTLRKNTDVAIYHETIVTLENVHKVLGKIENGSFYKRTDYENAKMAKDKKKIQEITDFYQELLFFNDAKLNFAFANFHDFFHWDSRISFFLGFVRECRKQEKFDQILSIQFGGKREVNLEKVFDFVNAYQQRVQQLEEIKSEHEPEVVTQYKIKSETLSDIQDQNEIYRLLMESYNDLKKRKFGTCVFDIILPSQFKSLEPDSESMSTSYLKSFLDRLSYVVLKDDGVLMRVNHTHILNRKRVLLSFLLIYKTKNYSNPQDIFDYYKRQVHSIVGSVESYAVQVINRQEMIQKVYPAEKFIGELRTDKQKENFRDKFLTYFLSSVFILQTDKVTEFDNIVLQRSLFLNDFEYYEEKNYTVDKKPTRRSDRLQIDLRMEGKKEYLEDLLTSEIIEKSIKYFPLTDISSEGLHRLKIITYLYQQHFSLKVVSGEIKSKIQEEAIVEGLLKTGKNIEERISTEKYIEKLIQAEKFITWLMYDDWYHGFPSKQAEKNFEVKPTFSKLSLPIRQVLLVSQMIKYSNHLLFPTKLKTEAVTLLKNFKNIFSRYKIDEVDFVENDLKSYKQDRLLPVLKKERVFFKKAAHTEIRIKNYIKQILENNVVIVRLIFSCDQFDNEKATAKVFDEMFREYIENLKRPHTEGLKLLGHVGTYVPNKKNHYIDATLFFLFDESIDIAPKSLINAVIEYWENYVINKDEQIKKSSEKEKEGEDKKEGDKTNPFNVFRKRKLRAISANVVKTETQLNHEYITLYKGRRKIQHKLIEKISMFYAYCPLILVEDKDLKYLPRKDCLILGRVRASNIKKGQKVTEAQQGNDNLPEAEPSVE